MWTCTTESGERLHVVGSGVAPGGAAMRCVVDSEYHSVLVTFVMPCVACACGMRVMHVSGLGMLALVMLACVDLLIVKHIVRCSCVQSGLHG